MATITTPVYLDGGTARTAGEAMTINSGGVLTIRTDTRVHANAPAAMAGSLAAITINEGRLEIDATKVRWLKYDTGSGNVPAIGQAITQGGVSGYLLGVWATLLAAPTAAAAAMPATGFIKFREVTGGAFAPGALTGIGANALLADVPGWIEFVMDQAVDITVPRLGKFQTRGDWFALDDTTGVRAQVLQTPVNGGGANTYVPGVWIETAPGSGVFDLWPALNGATNGWSQIHIGAPEGGADDRHKFVKMLTNGQMQIGETVTQAGTYVSVAAQAGTYATIADSGTYVWANNKATCYVAAGHNLVDGMQTGIDFTSGAATADGTYTVTVLDPYYFTVDLAGSGTGGNFTSRPGILVTFTAHGLNVNEQTYCDFTSGTGVDGTYLVYAVPSANTYRIAYPHIVALTAGNVSCIHTLTVTFTAHGLALGNRVYCDFTTGTAVDGTFTIKALAANTFNINYPHAAVIASSNVTIRHDIGKVPPAGCKTRIPNIITRQVATGARATNVVPHATAATRPEFITTSAGAIDLEYWYDTGFYTRFGQAYSFRAVHCAFTDTLEITELATAIDIDDVLVGMQGAQDLRTLQLTSNFAGGNIKNAKFQRGNAPGTTDHACEVLACKGQIFDNVQFGITQFVRSTGYPLQLSSCADLEINNCRVLNGNLRVTTCTDIDINDLDYVDRMMGYTNATTGYYAVYIETKSNGILVDGVTFGFNGAVPNVHPYAGIIGFIISDNIKLRNMGTFNAPLLGGSWAPNLYALAYIFVSGGNCSNLKIQRIFVDIVRTLAISTVNSDKGMLLESIIVKSQYQIATFAIFVVTVASLNCEVKGCYGINTTTGNSSVYGSHFEDFFGGLGYGRLILTFNEPTAETAAQFSMVSGIAKFNSAGGLLMGVIGDKCIWEDPFFRLGYTGFVNAAAGMNGGTIGNYALTYQINTGAGFGAIKTLSGANLAAEVINPAIGFKLRIIIETTTTNTTAMTFLRISLFTTLAAQRDNLYPLDTVYKNVSITNLVAGTEIHIYKTSDMVELYGVESSGTTFTWQYLVDDTSVFITIIKPGYKWIRFNDLILGIDGISIIATQQADLGYFNP